MYFHVFHHAFIFFCSFNLAILIAYLLGQTRLAMNNDLRHLEELIYFWFHTFIRAGPNLIKASGTYLGA